MDYASFRKAYEASGLSQKAYGEQIGKSASMVNYYLSKTKKAVSNTPDFAEVVIKKGSESKVIKITTSVGVTIEIPI